mmetsp:Transcript_15819/g.40308  ORF Transcript_15819/g.40308 Transcript_15819/m.40308 type:complete len:92 (+) Transcript_15819:620-895(+)
MPYLLYPPELPCGFCLQMAQRPFRSDQANPRVCSNSCFARALRADEPHHAKAASSTLLSWGKTKENASAVSSAESSFPPAHMFVHHPINLS